MKIKDSDKRTPRESDFIFWLFMLLPGAMTASTGTFSKVGMGEWGGPEVRLAGWLLFGVSVCGIFYCLQRLQSYGKGHCFLVTLFLLAVIIGAILPFISLHSYLRFLPICWIPILLLFGHLLHKTFVKAVSAQRMNKGIHED